MSIASTSNSGYADSDLVVLEGGNIKKRILKEGTGATPPHKAQVTVHYTGRLLDGTVFDSSKKRNEPFQFKIGVGQVIAGWDKGVSSMRVGEHSILTCSPDYAYGKAGSPPNIPPNSTLEFEVELLSFENKQMVTEDKGVMKEIITEGSGHNRPNDNASVSLTYTARAAGRVFESKEEAWNIKLNELPTSFPVGFEESVKNMYKGERSRFFISPSHGYGSAGCAQLDIAPNTHIEYEIHLMEFTKGKETFEMDFNEKLAHMQALKDRGNVFFKAGQLQRALKQYYSCVKVIQHDGGLTDEQQKQINAVRLSAYSNSAICDMKLSEYVKVISHCNEALQLEPTHSKCLYHRGLAHLNTGSLQDALNDLKAAHNSDANNKDITRELARCRAKLQSEADREKKAFGGFFNRVKLVSDEEIASAAPSNKQFNSDSDMSDEEQQDNTSDSTAETQQDNQNDTNMQTDQTPAGTSS